MSEFIFSKRKLSRVLHAMITIVLVLAVLLPATASVAQAQGETHTVVRGETLANIAVAYGVNSTELARVNSVSNTNLLYVGQQLTIPGESAASSTTTVQPDTQPVAAQPAVAASTNSVESSIITVGSGDTLSQIAKDYGMSMSEMLRINRMDDADEVFVGQQLRVMGSVAETTVAESTVAETAAAETAVVETAAVETTTAATTTAATTTSSVADSIYVVKYGDTLANIASLHGVAGSSIISANGLPNANFVWTGQRLRIPDGAAAGVTSTQSATQSVPVAPSRPAYGRKLIEVNLSNQTLTAWQGDEKVLHTSISSGTYKTPTVTGRFLVSWKLPSQHMYGDDFDLPNVPSVMYFYEGYAIHGAYWHNNFGMPMSHGCVNMVPSQASMLYDWAPVGTEVYVHY